MFMTDEAVLNAYALALTSGRVAEHWPDFGFPPLRDWAKEVEAGRESKERPKFPRAVESAVLSGKWRRLVETSEGNIGLAPDGAKPGEPLHRRPSYSTIFVSY